MNDDWLRELAQVNQENEAEGRSRLDERWDRLSAGELSPEEEAELKALAESSKEGREAYEAFRPLGPEFQASVVQAIQTQGLAAGEAPEAARMKQEPGKLYSFPRRARFAAWGTAAAAAAAILMISLREPVPLPVYAAMDVSGGASRMRGEQPEAADRDFAPGDAVQVRLPPQPNVSYGKRQLEAEGFLACDREVDRLEARRQIEPNGAVEIQGSIPEVNPGACTLWAVVCRRGKMLEAADLRTLAGGDRVQQLRDCVAIRQGIRIQPRGP